MKNYIFAFYIFITGNIFSQPPKEIEKNIFLKVIKNKFGITDSSNKVIVPFIYDYIEFKNHRLIVRKQNSQGLLSISNKIIIPIEYEFILPSQNDRFILRTHNSLFGLCDTSGKVLIQVKYKSLTSTVNSDYYISTNNKNLNGIYDINGKVVLDELYKFYTIDNYKIFATKENQPYIFNLQKLQDSLRLNKNINFIETQRHYSMGERFFQIVKQNNKFGVINSTNEIVVPIIYDNVKSSQHWKYFLFTLNNKIGLIKINGKIIKEPIYDRIDLLKEYITLKRKGKKDEFYSYEW